MRRAQTLLKPLAELVSSNPMMRRFALKCIPDWGRTIVIDPIGDFRIQLRRHRSYWIRDALTHERFMLGAL